MLKKIKRKLLPRSIRNKITINQNNIAYAKWLEDGCPVPPPHLVKQMAISDYQKKYDANVLVETGTYLGDMVEALKSNFKQVFSIELGLDLHKKAVKRFRKDANVTIIQGDSGKVMPKILKELNEKAIFWLDGHYSAGVTAQGDKNCPIFEELEHIFSSNKFEHVLLIDDARLFVGQRDYPTIEELTNFVQAKNDKYQIEVKDDIIRFTI